jgi:hypothetical protein
VVGTAGRWLLGVDEHAATRLAGAILVDLELDHELVRVRRRGIPTTHGRQATDPAVEQLP